MDHHRENSLKGSYNYLDPNYFKAIHRHNSFTDNHFQHNKSQSQNNQILDYPDLYRQETYHEDQLFKSFLQQYKSINVQSQEQLKKQQFLGELNNELDSKIIKDISDNNDKINKQQKENIQINSVVSLQSNQNNQNQKKLDYKNRINRINKLRCQTIIYQNLKNFKNQINFLKNSVFNQKNNFIQFINSGLIKIQSSMPNLSDKKKYNRTQYTQTQRPFLTNSFQNIQQQQIQQTPVPQKQQDNFFSVINQYKKIMDSNRKVMGQKNATIFSLQQKQQRLIKQKSVLVQQNKRLLQENELLNFEIKSYLNEGQLQRNRFEQVIKKLKKSLQEQSNLSKENNLKRMQTKQLELIRLKQNMRQKQNQTIKYIKQLQKQKLQIKTMDQEKNKYMKTIQQLRKQNKQISIVYQKKIQEINKQNYATFQQNFSLLQKIQSFQAQLQQKISSLKKQLKKQHKQNIHLFNQQIQYLKNQLANLQKIHKQTQQQLSHKILQIQHYQQKILKLQDKQKIYSQTIRSSNIPQFTKQLSTSNIHPQTYSKSYNIIKNNTQYSQKNTYQFINKQRSTQSNFNQQKTRQKPYEKSQYEIYNQNNRHQKVVSKFEQDKQLKRKEVKLQIEDFKKELNVSRTRNKNIYDESGQSTRNRQMYSNYRQIESKYSNLQKSRQKLGLYKKQYNRQGDLKKNYSHSRINIKENKLNIIKNENNFRNQSNKKNDFTRLEFQLENLSQQLKNQLIQFGRNRK